MNSTATYIHTPEVHNQLASDIVVPLLIELFHPSSVLDVGCGIGTWLNSFAKQGIYDMIGIDGDYVDRQLMLEHISPNKFTPLDLRFPFNLERTFDLVISLEVAEHLPEQAAQGFVDSLTRHADIIVFSAAIPGQGGQNHINEQWKSYWIDKFKQVGFSVFDLIRPRIWNNPLINWWYKQNSVVFSTRDLSYLIDPGKELLESVHPQLFQQHIDYIIYLQEYVSSLETKLYGGEINDDKTS